MAMLYHIKRRTKMFLESKQTKTVYRFFSHERKKECHHQNSSACGDNESKEEMKPRKQRKAACSSP